MNLKTEVWNSHEKRKENPMKLISEKYPLLGYDFAEQESLDEVYALSEKFIKIVLEERKSYAEACEAFSIAKKGLETLRH